MTVAPHEDLGEHIKAFAMAIYALQDALIDRGALEPGDWPAQLRRLDSPSQSLLEIVGAIARALDERHFKPVARRGLRVIDGGQDGVAP